MPDDRKTQLPVASTTTYAKADALEAKAPDLSPTSPKRDLEACAENFLPIALKPSTHKTI